MRVNYKPCAENVKQQNSEKCTAASSKHWNVNA